MLIRVFAKIDPQLTYCSPFTLAVNRVENGPFPQKPVKCYKGILPNIYGRNYYLGMS